MFERNRIETNAGQRDVQGCPVEVSFDDGTTVSGLIAVSRARGLTDTLNGAEPFLTFKPFDGQIRMIAKSTVRSVFQIDAPTEPMLIAGAANDPNFDPYAVLSVGRSASWDDIRSAFHRLSLAYHPDRYANAELPGDVTDYLSAMARRINSAYMALEALHYRPANRAKAAKPIYESRPRV